MQKMALRVVFPTATQPIALADFSGDGLPTWSACATARSATGRTSATAGSTGHSFDLVELSRIASETSYYPRSIQWWVFILFFIGFIVKLPHSRSTPGCRTPTSGPDAD